MTDLTPVVNQLLTEAHSSPPIPEPGSRRPSTETVDEFLKEAYRIVGRPLLVYADPIALALLTR